MLEQVIGDAQGKYDMRKFDVEVLKDFGCPICKMVI
jgi:hypothetical protein